MRADMNTKNLPMIGIAGGIASGKSSVSKYLFQQGYTVIDADKLGHRVLDPSEPSYQEIVEAFGSSILNDDATINRQKLGGVVFGDPEKLKALNAISHPRITAMVIEQVQAQVDTSKEGIVFLEAALILESKTLPKSQQIWLITTSPEQAVTRLVERNGFTEKEALSRVNAQPSNANRIPKADIVIENTSTLEALFEKIDVLLKTTNFKDLHSCSPMTQ